MASQKSNRPQTVLEHRPGPQSETFLAKAQTMQLTTTIRSPGALALGAFFAAVTARTIFDDVVSGAPATIAHLNAAAALVAAIASGHLVLPTLWQGRVSAALGLALIFVASTGYIVTSAGARNAEVSQHKASQIVKTNGERASLKGKVSEAETDVDEAKDAHDKAKRAAKTECDSGKGKRCDGKIETRDYAAKDLEKAESHAALTRGKLSLLGPEEQPFAGYKHAARVFASAGYGEANVIEARLELQMPFVLVLITEVSTLVFLGMGLGHRRQVLRSNGGKGTVKSEANKQRQDPAPKVHKSETTSASLPARVGRAEQVKTFCRWFREQTGREPTFSEVRDGLSLPAATASKYRRAALG